MVVDFEAKDLVWKKIGTQAYAADLLALFLAPNDRDRLLYKALLLMFLKHRLDSIHGHDLTTFRAAHHVSKKKVWLMLQHLHRLGIVRSSYQAGPGKFYYLEKQRFPRVLRKVARAYARVV